MKTSILALVATVSALTTLARTNIPFHLDWFTLAGGVVAVVQMPLGLHPIALVVDDGMLEAANALAVEVPPTEKLFRQKATEATKNE